MSLEKRVWEYIEGKRQGKGILGLLYLGSLVYKSGVTLRNWAYAWGIFKKRRLSCLVVSVGNIVAGGTGKTPFVALLAKTLLPFGKIGVLSRGYRSEMEKAGQVTLICEGKGNLFSPALCGDEPYWLCSQIPELFFWVGKDRVKAGQQADKAGCSFVLLDDGMQYRRLERDFEITLLDGKDLFGKGYFLPRGYLREDPMALKRADILIVNHIENAAHYAQVEKTLRKYTRAPIVGTRFHVIDTFSLKDKRLGVFCGIGKPGRFIELLRELGGEIQEQLVVLDHREIPLEELTRFAERCQQKGVDTLVCTAKDWVKLPPSLRKTGVCDLPIVPVHVELEITQGKEHWQELVEKIRGKLYSRSSILSGNEHA